MMMPSGLVLKKPLCLLIVFCLSLQETGLGANVPQAALIYSPEQTSARISEIQTLLPPAFGTVDELWSPSGDARLDSRGVIILHDAHGQPEAQKNTEEILKILDQHQRLDELFVEGGFGNLEPERLLFFEEEHFNKRAAEFLFGEGEIGGPELFLMWKLSSSQNGSQKKIKSTGAETRELYLRNLRAYQEVYSQKEKNVFFLEKYREQIDREALRIMNPLLERFFSGWMDYENKTVDLEHSLRLIEKLSGEVLNLDWNDAAAQLDWPMMVRFLELKRRGKLLDNQQADLEERALFQWLETEGFKKLREDIENELLEISTHPRSAENRRRLWQKFYRQVFSAGFQFEDYSHLFAREGFKILESEIEVRMLFSEMNKLRDQIVEKLQKTSREVEVLEAFRDYLLLKKLLMLELTREEYRNFQDRFKNFRKIPSEIREAVHKALYFYQLALARDESMAAPLVSRMLSSDQSPQTFVLVSGGFHTEGLKSIFQRKGISYAVISPHFSEIDESGKYEASMTGKAVRKDLALYKIRLAQWLNDWQGELPDAISKRRESLKEIIISQGVERGAKLRSQDYLTAEVNQENLEASDARSELRAAPWKNMEEIYNSLDRLMGTAGTPGRKGPKHEQALIRVFLKFAENPGDLRSVFLKESDEGFLRSFYENLSSWLDDNLSSVLVFLESEENVRQLESLLAFSTEHSNSAYINRLISDSLERTRQKVRARKKTAKKKTLVSRTSRKTTARSRPLPFSKRPKSDSVRNVLSNEERSELIGGLNARISQSSENAFQIELTLTPQLLKAANFWVPLTEGAVRLSFPGNLEGKTVMLEEHRLPGQEQFREIKVFEKAQKEFVYLFSFLESEKFGFSRSVEPVSVNADYTFNHAQFPEETFWVLTTQGFDVRNAQNKFRVFTDERGEIQKVVDSSGTPHPFYPVYEKSGEKRLGFFVMRMDGLWTPSEDFEGIVKNFMLGRERSSRGSDHDTAYIRVPGKNIYVAPGSVGLKRADVEVEGRWPVTVKVGTRLYPLILKRDLEGKIADVAREGFFDQLGNFTGTITRFRADGYGRASLGAPLTGIQVAEPSANGVWMSAALENGVILRTDEWRKLSPENPYLFEKGAAQESLRADLVSGAPRPRRTHGFKVLRDFKGIPLQSYTSRIPPAFYRKHSGLITGIEIGAHGEAGRVQLDGKTYQLPGAYIGHPLTVLRFPEEDVMLFVIHTKTGSRVKDAYLYQLDGKEKLQSAKETAREERELRRRYEYKLDLSRVWREKQNSELVFHEGRQAFQTGDLDQAETLLKQVSSKDRRNYADAQNLLLTWIPHRRDVLRSGTRRQQRRLLESFSRASNRASEEGDSNLSGRPELRDLEAVSPVLWAAGAAAFSLFAYWRVQIIYRRVILDNYDERVAAVFETAAEYKKQVPGLKPSQRLKLRQKLLRGYKEKFQGKTKGKAEFISAAFALFAGREAGDVSQQDQLRRVENIEKLLGSRLEYQLALAERTVLRQEGAPEEELQSAWPKTMRLPVLERIRIRVKALRQSIAAVPGRIYNSFLEIFAAVRERFYSFRAPETKEESEGVLPHDSEEEGPAAEAVGEPAVFEAAVSETSETETVKAEEETQEQKLERVLQRFQSSFTTKADVFVRQLDKVQSVQRVERILSDFDRELKSDRERIARTLDPETKLLFEDKIQQAVWVKETREKISSRLLEVRAAREKKAAEAQAARIAREAKLALEREQRNQQMSALTSELALLEDSLKVSLNRLIMTGEKVSELSEVSGFSKRIQQSAALDSFDKRLWQKRLADLVLKIQRALDEKQSDPWALERAVRETPEAMSLAESLAANEKEEFAEIIFTAIIWDFERGSEERNLALRRIIEMHNALGLFEDALLVADDLAWLLPLEPETARLLAELWKRHSEVLKQQNKPAEARDALGIAGDFLQAESFSEDPLLAEIEAAKELLGEEVIPPEESVRKSKPISGTRHSREIQSPSFEDAVDFDVLFTRLEEKLLTGEPVYDPEMLALSDAVMGLTLQIISEPMEETRREELFEQLDQLRERVSTGFRQARLASVWHDLDRLENTVRGKLKSYEMPSDVYEDSSVLAFAEKLESVELEEKDKEALTQELYRRMNFYGNLVWRQMNRRGLEYVRKHSRTLNDFMKSVSQRIEEARRLQRQGENTEAFELYAEVAQDVREAADSDMPREVRLSTLSRVIVAMSNTRRHDRSRPQRYEEALEIVEEALENVDPWSPFLTTEKGWVLFHWGKTLTLQKKDGRRYVEDALHEIETLLLRDERDASALDLKVSALVFLGQKREAFLLADWIQKEGIRKIEELTAYRELKGGRPELRSLTEVPAASELSKSEKAALLRDNPFYDFAVERNLWVRKEELKPFPRVTLETIHRAQKILHHFWTGVGELGVSDIQNGRFQIPLFQSAAVNDLMFELTGRKNQYYLYYLPDLPEGSFKPYLAADLLDRFYDHPETLAGLEMIVAESTGNQGKAVASLVQKLKQHPHYAPYASNLKAVIFVPKTANPEKIRAMKSLGAVVVNRRFSEEELASYVKGSETTRSLIEDFSDAPYFEDYRDASVYVETYASAHPETSHYIRHGAPMGVSAYAVIMLEALDQWYRLQRETSENANLEEPVSSVDFERFVDFVSSNPEFSKIDFWLPGGSAGLGSGIAQAKLLRPDIGVFLTQVPGVDHIFKSLKAGELISKEQAVFDEEALRYVDGIAATGESVTFEIIRGMADAVMRVSHQHNNRMARILLNLDLKYYTPAGSPRSLDFELSSVLPLTNAAYGRFFQSRLPALAEEGKHILIPVTGRTMDVAVEIEIQDMSYEESLEVIKAAGKFSGRAELRSISNEDRTALKSIEEKIVQRDIEAAREEIGTLRADVNAREAFDGQDYILQNLTVGEARILADEARFSEAYSLLDSVRSVNADFKDAVTARSLNAYQENFQLFEKYKNRLEEKGYVFVRKLGAGTFGDGYLFQSTADQKKVVLKVIGGTGLDMTEVTERMSASGQLAVEIDVNDKFYAIAGDNPKKALIPRNIYVFEEENELGISMPEAIVMNFLEGRPASDFLRDADEDERQIFFEQIQEKWLDLLRVLKEGGFNLLDYRPDNFFFRIEEENLVIESVDRGIMTAYSEGEEGRQDNRSLSATGAASVWKSFTGEAAKLDLRDAIRKVFNLESETGTYMKKSVRASDQEKVEDYARLLESLGFQFRGDDGKIGYLESYEAPQTNFNLVIIPHGVTDANQREVFHGRADSKNENLLNAEGRQQAADGAAALVELIKQKGWKIEDLVFLRSPLRRAGETAEISMEELRKAGVISDQQAVEDALALELAFGEWDGLTLSEIESLLGEDEKENALKYRNLNAVMRASSGENFLMMLERVKKALENWNEKYAGKTVVVYGHGTFSSALRVLFKSPEAQVGDYVTWRGDAIAPRGFPTLFETRQELRQENAVEDKITIETILEVGEKVTAGIYALSEAPQALKYKAGLPSAFAEEIQPVLEPSEQAFMIDTFSRLVSLGGKAVLPARVLEAVSPRVRELFVELFSRGADEASSKPVVYLAGEGASEIKETFFTYPVFQTHPAAQKLFELRSFDGAVVANRLRNEAVAVSFTDLSGVETLAAAIPAFWIKPEEIRKLGEADQARLLVRMTQLQLMAAVELKDRLTESSALQNMAQFLGRAGVAFTQGEGGYLAPSVQSLLSETVAARLAAYAATAKSA